MVDYDLHIHSTFSDGILTPEEIFKIADTYGLRGLSVTDHDTVDCVNDCINLAKRYHMDYIPGIELSTDYSGHEVHILGYYVDYSDSELLHFLDELKSTRYKRARKMTEKIYNCGYSITFDEVLEEAGSDYKAIGRPHIARVLVKKGYFKDMAEVFETLIGCGKRAYVERFKISTEDGIQKILKAKGIPVIAHPLINKNFIKRINFPIFIEKLVKQGVAGIEAYHTLQTNEDSKYLIQIAERLSLIVTGGSDCHGKYENKKYLLGSRGVSINEANQLKCLKRW